MWSRWRCQWAISSLEMPVLNGTKEDEGDGSKGKGKLKANVTTIRWITNPLADRSNEPRLRHAHDSPKDAETKGKDGGNSRR